MLTNKNFTIDAKTEVDGVNIVTHRAILTAEDVTFLPITHDKELYKQHRVEIRKDAADFEEYAYQVQETIFAK